MPVPGMTALAAALMWRCNAIDSSTAHNALHYGGRCAFANTRQNDRSRIFLPPKRRWRRCGNGRATSRHLAARVSVNSRRAPGGKNSFLWGPLGIEAMFMCWRRRVRHARSVVDESRRPVCSWSSKEGYSSAQISSLFSTTSSWVSTGTSRDGFSAASDLMTSTAR